MNRRTLLAALGTATTATVAGCSSALSLSDTDPCDGDDCDIGMTRNEFVPESYEVRVGETVVWKNTSGADHTVTAFENDIPDEAAYFATGDYDDEETAVDAWHDYRGGRLGTRDTFEHTFEVAGRYGYFCEPHIPGGMVGEVIVVE